ncbi:MAG TPA: hypothetical protein VLC07_04870, partial [Solirubrobacterales bacterium]|nr:hypothetical protein [Solirubrobacterales bacterium]
LVRLGLRLGWDDIDDEANDRFTTAIVGALEEERSRVCETDAFKTRLADAAEVGLRAITISAGETVPVKEERRKLLAVSRNIDNAYADASRRLGDTGIAVEYLKSRVDKESQADLSALKLELYALVGEAESLERVEARAENLADETLESFETEINSLPEDKRQLYRAIRRQGATARAEPWDLPFDIQVRSLGDQWDRHVYVNQDGGFAATFNSLEKRVLSEELENPDVIGWLRNEPSKPWAFSLSYERHGEEHEMYPDFVVFRMQGGMVVVDLLEPHSQRESDSVAKARGLATFAGNHGDRFGRIELIDEIKVGPQKRLKRLPLKEGKWQKLVKDTHTEGHLMQHFVNAP